jgi:tRNA (cmo5U34)-methyltransferase
MSGYSKKSSPEEIRHKFNSLVDRYSDTQTGQNTAVDSALIAELIARVAANVNPEAREILDIGCGAGNYAIRMATFINAVNVTLIDLSEKMLNKAADRISEITKGKIRRIWGDIRDIQLQENQFDIVVAGTSLHHLRDQSEWDRVFLNVYKSLKTGGSFWISDLIVHDHDRVQKVLRNNFSDFLVKQGGYELRDYAFEQMEIEDTPRSISFQTELLKKVGFRYIEILHKNMVFAAFGGIK